MNVELESPESLSSIQTEAVITPDNISQTHTLYLEPEAEQVTVDEETFKSVPEHSGDLQTMLKQAEVSGRPVSCPFIRSMGSKGIELAQKWAAEQQQPVQTPKPTMREILAQKKASENLDKTQGISQYKPHVPISVPKKPQLHEIKPVLPVMATDHSSVLGIKNKHSEKSDVALRSTDTSELTAAVVSQNEVLRRLKESPVPIIEYSQVLESVVSFNIPKVKTPPAIYPIRLTPVEPTVAAAVKTLPPSHPSSIKAATITLNNPKEKSYSHFEPITAQIKAHDPNDNIHTFVKDGSTNPAAVSRVGAELPIVAAITNTEQVLHIGTLSYVEMPYVQETTDTILHCDNDLVYSRELPIDPFNITPNQQSNDVNISFEDTEISAFSVATAFDEWKHTSLAGLNTMEGLDCSVNYLIDEEESSCEADIGVTIETTSHISFVLDSTAKLCESDATDEHTAFDSAGSILTCPAEIAPCSDSTDMPKIAEVITRKNGIEVPTLKKMDSVSQENVLLSTLAAAGKPELLASRLIESDSSQQLFDNLIQQLHKQHIETSTDLIVLEQYETSIMQLCAEFMARADLQDARFTKQFLACLKQLVLELSLDYITSSLEELSNSGTHEHKFGHKVSPLKLIQAINQTVRQQLWLGKCVLAAVAA